LTEAILTGDRPAHLDSCDVCARRALDLGRWLDDTRTLAVDAADAAFPAERLAAQQSQVLRRLEQIDEPPRVIAFPAATTSQPRELARRRVAPAWVGVAAAAGLVVGVVGGQVSARLSHTSAASPQQGRVAAPAPPPVAVPVTPQPVQASLLDLDLEGVTPEPLRGIDDITPKLVPSRYTVAQR
jgi:hypothetical protein